MDFAMIFHNESKICEQVDLSEMNFSMLDASNFAWLNIDLNQKNATISTLKNCGFQEGQMSEVFQQNQPYYFLHGQNQIIELLQVCYQEKDEIISTSLLLAMNEKAIITAHSGKSDIIHTVLNACEESFQSVGKSPGFIFFLIWDAMIDSFLPQVFSIDEKLEQLEEHYLHGSDSKTILNEIIKMKKMVRQLKQSLAPMQRAMRHIVNVKLELISTEARNYLQGHFTHLDRLSQTIDSLQNRVHATLAGYNSTISQQINNSMKVLAIIATIMMPLSLLAGIYGTNFDYIPELNWKYGYFVFLCVLFVLGLIMLILFKRKKWL